MKINENIFSYPPYLSTSWSNVAAIHMRDGLLIVSMIDGEVAEIPNLTPKILDMIFECHVKHLEEKEKMEAEHHFPPSPSPFMQPQELEGGLPFRFSIGGMEAWGAAMQHNPEQKNMPSLPEDVLSKVRAISKILSPEDAISIPKAEPHCNCMHCQIARAINQGLGLSDIYHRQEETHAEKANAVEEVNDDDLHFQQWEIHQSEEKLYTVTNKLDTQEKYNVYLGHPVGCTCGKQGCEHILAVLKS